MNDTKKLLEERKRLKASKPTFVHGMFGKRKRIKSPWRDPRGTRNKVGLQNAGRRKVVKIGYKMSEAVRHLTPEGLKVAMVSNLREIEMIDPKKQAAMIRSSVGLKKRIDILKKAEEKKIKILNFRDPAKFIEEKLTQREEERKEKQKKKATISEKVKAEEKKKEEPKEEKKLEDTLEAEDKKREDKVEADKLLIKPR